MTHFGAYIRILTLTTALGLAIVILFNVIVDPYGVTDSGVFDAKPYASSQVRMFKAYGITRTEPRTIAIGNSRVEVGLDPASDQWPVEYRPVYNLGIPGAGVYASRRFLQHAIAHRPPEIVVFGLDFMDFRAEPFRSPSAENPFDRRFLVREDGSNNGARRSAVLHDWLVSAASLDALLDSVGTLRQRSDPKAPNLTKYGFNPLREYPAYVRSAGHFTLFKQRDLENLRAYFRRPWRITSEDGEPARAFKDLASILELCRKHEIRLYLYIHPVHAHLNETIRIAGLWPAFEEWKRKVTGLVEANNALYPRQPPIELWDFSGYSPVTTEVVPEKGDFRPMRWYWEAGHYKSSLGELVLQRMLHRTELPALAETSFGVRINARNIDAHLARIREERQAYREQNPAGLARLERMAEQIGSERSGR